ANDNKNRDFYSDTSDPIDPTTFVVKTHTHLGVRIAKGYERNHGDVNHAGANHVLEHRLQARIADLMHPGSDYYAAMSYFVVGDRNLTNNTVYRRFTPGAGGINPTFVGGNLRGPFLPPNINNQNCIPGPAPQPGFQSSADKSTWLLGEEIEPQ